MQDKPHIAAHKIKGQRRIWKCGSFAGSIYYRPYNSTCLRIFTGYYRKQLID